MLVDNLLPPAAMEGFYNSEFRHVFEDHCSVFRDSASTRIEYIDPALAFQFEFDFYMLLKAKGIPNHLHWYVLRLTGFHDPYQSNRNLSMIFVPNEAELTILYSQWLSK